MKVFLVISLFCFGFSSMASEITAAEAEAATPVKTTIASEAAIPVVIDGKAAASSDNTSLGQKVLFSFSILGVLVLTTWMFGRKYLKKGLINVQNHQIRILSQTSLGPKKSLAVIRVAGESVLIGITDTQISMIKSLSLLDEDLPEQTPFRFDNALQAADAGRKSTPIENDSITFASLKTQVSSKLQSMKVIE